MSQHANYLDVMVSAEVLSDVADALSVIAEHEGSAMAQAFASTFRYAVDRGDEFSRSDALEGALLALIEYARRQVVGD